MSKMKERIIAFILALTIPLNLAGCKDDKTSLEGSEEKKDNVGSLEELPNNHSAYISKREVDITEFLKRMAEITPLYNLEELYLTDEEIAEIRSAAETIQTCDYDGTDYSGLAKTIMKNSYPAEPENLLKYGGLRVTSLDIMRNNLQRAIDIVFETPSNISEDICLMRTLKIKEKTLDGVNAISIYDYDTNTLYVDYKRCFELLSETREKIEYLYTMTNSEYEDKLYTEDEFFTKIYAHALNQVRFHICNCRKSKGQVNTEVSHNHTLTNLVTVASENQVLYSSRFNTGEGEKLPNSLYFNRSYEPYYLLLAAFDRKTDEEYYRAIFDADLNALYDFFGLKTEADFDAFYRIDEAINLLNYLSRSSKALEEETGIQTLNEYWSTIGYSYRIDVFKMAMKSLMERINKDGDYTPEECLFLYNFAKNYIINYAYSVELGENEEGEQDFIRVYEPAFLEAIGECDSIFYSFIQEMYGLNMKKIEGIKNTVRDYYYVSILVDEKSKPSIDSKRLSNRFPLLKSIYERTYVNSWELHLFESEYETMTTNTQEKSYTISPVIE